MPEILSNDAHAHKSLDPFVDDWPPTDPDELAALEAEMDIRDAEREAHDARIAELYLREHGERFGNGDEE